MPEARSRGAQAQVDLFAVSGTELRVVEHTDGVDGGPCQEHAEANAAYHLRAADGRMACDEPSAFVDAGVIAVELEGIDDRFRHGAYRSEIREGRHRGDSGFLGSAGQTVEPALRHDRVGIQDDDVP
jgi:hypothetical protein